MRASGILLPIASLPSRYGIGTFSKEGYEFVNFLQRAGQKFWQILPMGPTGYGDSPYQSFSTFAGNPYFIDLGQLIEKQLLTEEECKVCEYESNPRYIEYKEIYDSRFLVLHKAFSRVDLEADEGFAAFYEKNSFWLEDYSLYMAVKNHFKGISWIEWDEDIRLRKKEAVAEYKVLLKEEIRFYQYLQYEFAVQWGRLKKYANDRDIQIIGDIPIYVAFDSADSWANPELFQFDEEGMPKGVAGCPPDAFSATGQLWGNPLYDWEYHKETSYEWWMKRIDYCFGWYDYLRIDHFRGFDEYYSIPYGDETAEFGHWEKGPGISFFEVMNEQLGERNIIAEDLGYLTPTVHELLAQTGYPGMKVLEFAFDDSQDSTYLPYKYANDNCIVYTGTHDNQTLKAWYHEMSHYNRAFLEEYMGMQGCPEDNILDGVIRLALNSAAKLAVVPIQDYLHLEGEARTNEPSTLGDNWKWRISMEELTQELADKIARMSWIYGRR